MPQATESASSAPQDSAGARWDTSSHEAFFAYYADRSASPEMVAHAIRLRDSILAVLAERSLNRPLDVADIGGGAGALAMVWARSGHNAHCIDINAPLIELGRQRAAEAGVAIDFDVASATELPWADQSMDVCVLSELLEHVADWQPCLDEFARVLRPGGVGFLSTTNALCPRQNEFNLPLYSWYPAPLKAYCVRLATGPRPDLANYAKYPAVNWFTLASLQSELRARGFTRFLDRFDIAALRQPTGAPSLILDIIRRTHLTRWLGQLATPSTVLLAVK